MCVIIVKKPGILLPFEKIDSACHVNNDGWGLTVLQDKNSLLNYKKFDPKGNDPDEVFDLIQKYKDYTQYIHLRFTTKGEKSTDNCHPFPLIEEEDYQLYLMHNGTLSFNKLVIPDKQSDTRAFVEQYASPAAKAYYAIAGKDLLSNEPFIRLMDMFITSGWTFLLYDNLGNYKVIGGTSGVYFDAEGVEMKGKVEPGTASWWASNSYSFAHDHRQPYTKTSYYRSRYSSWQEENDWPSRGSDGKLRVWDAKTREYKVVEEKKDTKGNVTTTTFLPKPEDKKEDKESIPFLSDKTLKAQGTVLGYALAEAKRKGLDWATHTPPKERATFAELCNLNSLSEACLLNEEDIEEIVGEYPEAAVVLILDLLHALYTNRKAIQRDAA